MRVPYHLAALAALTVVALSVSAHDDCPSDEKAWQDLQRLESLSDRVKRLLAQRVVFSERVVEMGRNAAKIEDDAEKMLEYVLAFRKIEEASTGAEQSKEQLVELAGKLKNRRKGDGLKVGEVEHAIADLEADWLPMYSRVMAIIDGLPDP